MNTLDKKYQDLLQDILDNGVHKSDRTGTGTISVFGRQIRHNMKQGFPILTTKKVAWKGVVSELLWFLTGQTNISFLLKHNNHIWDGDVYKNYAAKTSMDVDGQYTKEQFIETIQTDKEFAKKWGDLGPIYGKQWRKWKGDTWVEGNTDGTEGFYLQSQYVDQIDNLINELKTNPDSRRLMVSAWNVGELDQMVLPPCHYGFQVYTRELNEIERGVLYSKQMEGYVDTDDVKTTEHYDSMNIPKRAISLMWNQRSVDTFLGLPFNIASYGLLLHIIANEVNMIPDELIGNLGDTHLYSNHIEQAKEQIGRDPFDLPQLKTDAKIDGICCNTPDNFVLEGYQSHPAIKAPLSN
jgi:thymidylate synthase